MSSANINDLSGYAIPLLNDTLSLVQEFGFCPDVEVTPWDRQVALHKGSENLYWVLSMGIPYQNLRRMAQCANQLHNTQPNRILDEMVEEAIKMHSGRHHVVHTIH